jgi:hypothetical protein
MQNQCLLYPQKRTCTVHQRMSALCHKQTFRHSFDHLVSAAKERGRESKTERPRGLKIYDELDLRRPLRNCSVKLPP